MSAFIFLSQKTKRSTGEVLDVFSDKNYKKPKQRGFVRIGVTGCDPHNIPAKWSDWVSIVCSRPRTRQTKQSYCLFSCQFYPFPQILIMLLSRWCQVARSETNFIPRPLPSPAVFPPSSDLREVSVAPQETRHYNVSGLAVSPHNLAILPRTAAGRTSQSFSLFGRTDGKQWKLSDYQAISNFSLALWNLVPRIEKTLINY